MPSIEPRPPLTVEIDIPITRRLKMHAVLDRDGVQIFHTRRLGDLFIWLLDNDTHEFTMLSAGDEFRITLHAPSPVTPNL